jgi:N-acetylglutamate synthase-like GNAT family acetyltransferase
MYCLKNMQGVVNIFPKQKVKHLKQIFVVQFVEIDSEVNVMIIRVATEEDLPGILELYSQPELDDKQVLDVKEAKAIFDKIKLYPDYHLYVAETDGIIVGTFALAIMDNLAHMGSKSGLIEDVAVSKPLQGQGIGKQMMKFAIEICREKSCYKVCLSSNLKRLNAHNFYESIGFKIHGYSFLTELEQQ